MKLKELKTPECDDCDSSDDLFTLNLKKKNVILCDYHLSEFYLLIKSIYDKLNVMTPKKPKKAKTAKPTMVGGKKPKTVRYRLYECRYCEEMFPYTASGANKTTYHEKTRHSQEYTQLGMGNARKSTWRTRTL